MMVDRQRLKSAVVGMLGAIGNEHPLKHQDSKAARFVVTNDQGRNIEIMVEKNSKSPCNIWLAKDETAPVPKTLVPQNDSPKSGLYTKIGKDGRLLYGSHSALERMPRLGETDLVRFAPRTLKEAGIVLDAMLTGRCV